ncbi:hypothetical protein SAMN05216377_110158 [Pseudonocardia oroxyli]|uniref:Uncharacterized protein n=1 Tax=Pseudonocardia oroxyli TaxID=366584 RepID=A0A1G7T294_PSEOR|nr:hypothetical protein SAMN05216377_110158 [Pseudonocardia oroxyli]
MFTPICCPGCTAIVIVPDFSADFAALGRHCPCCGIDVNEARHAELVPVPARLSAEGADGSRR